MLFEIAKRSHFLQNLVVKIIALVHPSIEHNIDKVKILKKAIFHCELENIEGSYFEFGVFEGASLYAAVSLHRGIKSKIKRNFYGFDSFDYGFRYFEGRDRHPFFKEGDFKSPYKKVANRLKRFNNVRLIRGYFEETVKGKLANEISGRDCCAIIFIDCDLMGPALIALNFIKPILQKGSVIILDDYWAYRGSRNHGTCGALNEFLRNNQEVKLRDYYSYGHGGHSFIVSEI
ncbi:MAG: macrocin O-methyltransferase [Candidatus Omnitrophica bacterium]|jgi:hypothetical protein|nr:macrocin O-methyltransferase [Candidatus Omnitrophota bacterium]